MDTILPGPEYGFTTKSKERNFYPGYVLIEAALTRSGMEKHWNFRNERCYRTLKEELYWVKADPFIGTKHTALHDAYNEAAHLYKLLQELRKLRPE